MATAVRVVGRDPLGAQQWKTQRPDNPEDLWQPLYDRVNVTPTAATAIASPLNFFTTPKGQSATLITGAAAPAAKVKTYRDTNLESAGVSPTKMYLVKGISIGFVHRQHGGVSGTVSASTNAADRDLVMEGGYFHLRVVDKDILFLPLMAMPVINPYAAMASTMNNTVIPTDNHGGGNGVAMYRLPIPITFNPYENFLVECVFDGTVTIANEMDMYIFLHSFLRRPT
jgi:hypothetical protein